MQVFPYGLSDHEQACMMMSLKTNVANGNVICTDEQLATYTAGQGTGNMVKRGTTHTVRLAEHFRGGPQVDALKMDVEGFEPYVLSGAGTLSAPNSDFVLAKPELQVRCTWRHACMGLVFTSSISSDNSAVLCLSIQIKWRCWRKFSCSA